MPHVGQIRGHPPRQVERAAQDLGPSRVQTFGHHFGFEGKPLQPRSPAARGRASTRCATFTSPRVLRSSYGIEPEAISVFDDVSAFIQPQPVHSKGTPT